jgi:hypothetical protein
MSTNTMFAILRWSVRDRGSGVPANGTARNYRLMPVGGTYFVDTARANHAISEMP